MRCLVIAMLLFAGVARADGELCRPGAKYHGAPIDLDVKSADLHELLRLIADVGHVNLVVPDEVSGKVTIKLRHVPWDQAACAVAAVHKLSILVDGNILIVRPR